MNYSVIIPAFNAASTLGLAIDSALGQTLRPADMIVVDDGSADDTSAVAARYAPRVRVIRQNNQGPAAARNHGARESCGEWLAFLDADDSWLPEKMTRQLSRVIRDDVAVIHARKLLCGRPAPPQITFDDLWRQNCICLSSAVVRRPAFNAAGGFDEARELIGVEDYNLWLRVAAAGMTIETIPENLIQYAPGVASLSRQHERFALAELANVRKIAGLLRIDPSRRERKLLEIHLQYGRDLIAERELIAARRLLSRPLLRRPTWEAICLWLATFVPTSVLNLRRRVLRRSFIRD